MLRSSLGANGPDKLQQPYKQQHYSVDTAHGSSTGNITGIGDGPRGQEVSAETGAKTTLKSRNLPVPSSSSSVADVDAWVLMLPVRLTVRNILSVVLLHLLHDMGSGRSSAT